MNLRHFKNCGLLLASLLAACGGGSPSKLAQFETGLVGQYELIELHGPSFDLVHLEGDARLGELLLQDDNSFQTFFSQDAEDALGTYGDSGDWRATLSTITFNGVVGGYDTSAVNDIGVGIGELLTVELEDVTYVWLKITTPPKN